MRRMISAVLVCFLLCGCTALNDDISSSSVDVIESTVTDISDAFEVDAVSENASSETTVSSETSDRTTTSIESSVQQTTSDFTKTNTNTESKQKLINECEVFSDLFRTDYIYNQSDYCSDGRNIYIPGSNYIIYDTVTKTYAKIDIDGYRSASGLYIYNGYLTSYIETYLEHLDGDRIFVYNLSTKEYVIIDDIPPFESAFVYGDYIYVKGASGSPMGGFVQRSLIDTDDRKWETIVDAVYEEFTTVGKYLFGNRGQSKQMYRVDLSTGEVYNYTNGLIFEKAGHFQSDNWIMTNQGVFDVGSNSIKYANEIYDVIGDVGIKFKTEYQNYKMCLVIDFLNFETGDKVNKVVDVEPGMPMGSSEGDRFALKGCTYNGLYDNNVFLKYINNNGVLDFEKIIVSENFYEGSLSYHGSGYGCLFLLNDYYYFLQADSVYKSPLSDLNNKTRLLQ